MFEINSKLYTENSYVVPLGNNCLIASIMDTMGIRGFSMPFDWVFSSLSIIEHSIATDFANWLSIEKLVSQYPRRRCGHLDYGPNFFNHHDPSRHPDRESYKRRIVRFRELTRSNARLDFVTTGSAYELRNSKTLSNFFLRDNTFLHEIRLSSNLPSGDVRQTRLDDHTVTIEIGCQDTFPETNQLSNGKTIADPVGLKSVKSILDSIVNKT